MSGLFKKECKEKKPFKPKILNLLRKLSNFWLIFLGGEESTNLSKFKILPYVMLYDIGSDNLGIEHVLLVENRDPAI